MTGLVRHKLASTAHGELIKLIRTSTDPNSTSVAPALATILKQSAESISAIVRNEFDSVHLEAREKALRAEFEKALVADTWRKRFRGRDVLKQFVARIQKTNYEVFRDLIIANMRDSGFTPEGMRLVMESILAA
jgi:hypothetical protein